MTKELCVNCGNDEGHYAICLDCLELIGDTCNCNDPQPVDNFAQ